MKTFIACIAAAAAIRASDKKPKNLAQKMRGKQLVSDAKKSLLATKVAKTARLTQGKHYQK